MTIREALAPCEGWMEPRSVEGNPFRLACRLRGPASPGEIERAWRGVGIPPEVEELWRTYREAELFADVDYGQWGLRLLPPDGSAARTASEREERRDDFQDTDVVIGEFLGDQDLVVLDALGQVRVALPLDPRSDWYRVGASLTEFLSRYVNASGDKYWEAKRA
jgi:hypothetical protein